ncbi:MAG: hypothetical protein IKI77_09525 [Oscillospiraceae bacterium]|nr:hypothetical protein [Oscillospiraceae bacterium]
MKIKYLCCGIALLLALQSVPQVSAAKESVLLDVSDFAVMDENLVYLGADYLNAAGVLFDDQDKVPESPEKTSVDKALWDATNRGKNWKPNLQSEFGEDSFYIDMGANYVVTGLCFLDNNGVQDWVVEDGEPFAWKKIGGFTTDAYQTWRGISFDSPRTTRYLRFSTPCGDSGVAELAIYGYYETPLSAAQKEKTAAHSGAGKKTDLTAGQRIGFNAFIDDPMTAIMAAGNVREYHNFSWLLDSDASVKFTQGTWGDMDSYYAAMHAQGISVIPCFQGGSTVVSGGEKPPEIPVPAGADPTDAASYAIHAQAMYQVAARYGSNPDVDPKTLHVSALSEPKTGLGLLRALENCNEPNKTWSGKANYFSPYELAAMCSADYDGHEGMIPNAGVRNADPDFKLAVGGLLNTASLLDYLSEMKLWFDYHRSDGKFAVDMINVHIGPDTANPEDSGFTARIAQILEWIDRNAPDTELWISEFEVPMHDCETEGVDNHDNEIYQLRYAQRVARTYLMALGSGVDRMTKFQLRDEGEGVYYNSGLVTGKGEWSKKLAWYYTACMTNLLKNAYFAADMTDSAVQKYFFIDRADGTSIYALWLPASSGQEIKNCRITVPEKAHVYLTVPGTYAEGVTTELPVSNGAVQLTVSETPVFLSISSAGKKFVNGRYAKIPPQKLSLQQDFSGEICDFSQEPKNGTLAQCYRLFDEQDSMPDYLYGDTAGIPLPKTNATGSEATCYVQFDQPYVLDGFGVYDTYGTGRFAVYDGHTDQLLWASDLGSYMSRSISLIADTAPTDLLKIVKSGGDLNEFAAYGYPAGEQIPMDVNADGAFNTADLTALVKWLTAASNQLANPAAADADKNGRLDARDLALLKRALLK